MGNALLIILVLLLFGLIGAGLRWGQLGFHLFGACWHRLGQGIDATWGARGQLWSNKVLRLCLLALMVVLADWVSVVIQHRGIGNLFAAMDEQRLEALTDERYLWTDRSYYGMVRLTIGDTAGPVDTYARMSARNYLWNWVWKEKDPGRLAQREQELKQTRQDRKRVRRGIP